MYVHLKTRLIPGFFSKDMLFESIIGGVLERVICNLSIGLSHDVNPFSPTCPNNGDATLFVTSLSTFGSGQFPSQVNWERYANVL
jgi:hypothetical protein